jgi:FkbH-like protein
LHRFAPNAVLFAFDLRHLFGQSDARSDLATADVLIEETLSSLRQCWDLARRHFAAQVIQQAVLPTYPALFGSNEHRLPGSRQRLADRFNAQLRPLADAAGIDVLAVDTRAAIDGLAAWHDPVLWHCAKQDIHPGASPLYGDLVARLIGAQQGRSAKCLVLDLDNTLWGGVIGDDGLEGIVLGQGSALGEAYVAFQEFLRQQMQRGIILAVCSKNDEANALAPFLSHPDMVLRRDDISCFIANWHDKASNIRQIAERLNIGLESLVLVDDDPFERRIVRGELPMVAVPELPDDPALYPACLADAGYLEGRSLTVEDLERTRLYRAEARREEQRTASTDLAAYLRELKMEMRWQPFDVVGLPRIVQLINKTNQFNLTTRRYTESEVRLAMTDPLVLTLQLRLVDQFGDNGIIAIVIGRMAADGAPEMRIDTWLMSCRVLGRQVEQATLNLLVEHARGFGAARLTGEYRPTAKNGMVRDHYRGLGFSPLAQTEDGTTWSLALGHYKPFETFIALTAT